MRNIYLLTHQYQYQYRYRRRCDYIQKRKKIGIYSSYENAKKVIEKYKGKQGFVRFPISCFHIEEYKLDQDYWQDGFTVDKHKRTIEETEQD